MKKRKRILILTGAGAAYPWFEKDVVDASTTKITQKICEDPFCKMIHKGLSECYSGPAKDLINFETIVNSIERIFLWYRGQQSNFNSDFPVFFQPKDLITKYFPLENGYYEKNEIVVRIAEKYNKQILKIAKQIEPYSKKIKASKEEINGKLCSFLEYLKKGENVLRAYTTNYDQMFMDVTKSSSVINFYDGYKGSIRNSISEFELSKILKSDRIDCCYNLHGSIYWHWKHEINSSVHSRFFQTDQCISEPDFSEYGQLRKDAVQEANPQEPYILSPIITGFNKLQRINQEPFNAFSNAFYRD